MSFFQPQNPGLSGLDELTSAEEALVQSLSALGDPGADRILFWDESANAYAFLSIGSGLSITGTTISSTGGGSSTFISLTDAPASYTGQSLKSVRVNVGETGLEFFTAAGTGTVTSVAATVPTGLTISGSPITASGTLAIGLDTGYVIPLQSTLDGKVPYTGATANVDLGAHNLTVDTNTFFVDSTNNRVGIGTTTPSGKLEVAQNITAYPTTGTYGQVEITGSTTPAMRLSMGVRTDTEKGFIQSVKSAAAYKDLLLNPLGGNVGIGVTGTPGGVLEVVGLTRVTNGNIEVYDTANSARGLTLYRNSISLGGINTNSTQVSFYAVTGYDLDFWVNSSGLLAMKVKNSTGAVQVNTQIELGHASDTTLSRVSAGVVAIEGVNIVTTSSTDTLINKTLTAPKFADLGFIADANGNEMLIFDTVASAVNEITIANAATTGTPTISATGGDTNINLQLTPKGTGIVKGELKRFMVRLLANTTDTATGTTIGGDYRISNRAITVKAVGAYVDTAGTTNTTTIDINEAGTTILSTKITIDSTEKSSETAATAPVISDTAIAADAVVTFDIDAISTTPAKGLTVWVDYVFQ